MMMALMIKETNIYCLPSIKHYMLYALHLLTYLINTILEQEHCYYYPQV